MKDNHKDLFQFSLLSRGGGMINISMSDLASHILLKITGSIRLTDAESLMNPFEQVLEESRKDVIVDLSECPVMSSLGIGKIIFLNERLKQKNRSMEIVGIHKNLLALLNSMKLNMVLKIREE